MASIRLSAANAVLRNLMRVNINKNICVTIHRDNHTLAGRSICFMNRISFITPLQNSNLFKVTYRLEHATVIPNKPEADEKTSSSSTVSSTSNHSESNEVQSVSKAKEDESSEIRTGSQTDESILPEIPDAPTGFSYIEEPTLESLGLGGWSPSGIVQQILEFFHVTFEMPWWACIISLTLIIRSLMFPLIVKSRRLMVHYQNSMPEFQKLQHDLSVARKSGNYYEAARTSQEFSLFLQKNSLAPGKMFLMTFIQAPVFISVYFALRNMANIPDFTSFQTGGIWWFKDLSLPDQFFALPLLTSITIWATLKFGTSLQSFPTQLPNNLMSHIVKVFQLVVPVIVFLFTMNFPSAVLCYWTSSNIFVLGQTFLLNMESVRKYFKIPTPITHSVVQNEKSNKLGFIEGFKESYTNMKITKEIEQRELLNAIKFEEVGNKPSKRTFKFDPTKVPKISDTKGK